MREHQTTVSRVMSNQNTMSGFYKFLYAAQQSTSLHFVDHHVCAPYLVSLLMVGITAALVGTVAFFWASSLKSWLISGEE